jgi:ketosteroid isomerase-like protein
MAHPLDSIIRDAYAAFNRGDLAGYLAACTPDFSFNVPGSSAVAGSYVGTPGLTKLAGLVIQIAGASFQEDVEDVLANDVHAVVLARHRFTRAGAAKDYRTAHVYEVRDGKLARCYEQPRDMDAFEDAWGPR